MYVLEMARKSTHVGGDEVVLPGQEENNTHF